MSNNNSKNVGSGANSTHGIPSHTHSKIKLEDIEKVLKLYETDFGQILMAHFDKKFTEEAKTLNGTYGVSPAKTLIDELKKLEEITPKTNS